LTYLVSSQAFFVRRFRELEISSIGQSPDAFPISRDESLTLKLI